MEVVGDVNCCSMTVDEVDGCRWLVVDDLRDLVTDNVCTTFVQISGRSQLLRYCGSLVDQ